MPYFSSSFGKKVYRKIDYVLNLFDKHSPQRQRIITTKYNCTKKL